MSLFLARAFDQKVLAFDTYEWTPFGSRGSDIAIGDLSLTETDYLEVVYGQAILIDEDLIHNTYYKENPTLVLLWEALPQIPYLIIIIAIRAYALKKIIWQLKRESC